MRPFRRYPETRTWETRIVNNGYFNTGDWDYAEGRNEKDAALYALTHDLCIDDFQEWQGNGEPDEIIVEVRKSEKAKKIVKVRLTPTIEIDWNADIIKPEKVPT